VIAAQAGGIGERSHSLNTPFLTYRKIRFPVNVCAADKISDKLKTVNFYPIYKTNQ
jgi:hypothetical protein